MCLCLSFAAPFSHTPLSFLLLDCAAHAAPVQAENQISAGGRGGRFGGMSDKKKGEEGPLVKICHDVGKLSAEQVKGLSSQVGSGSWVCVLVRGAWVCGVVGLWGWVITLCLGCFGGLPSNNGMGTVRALVPGAMYTHICMCTAHVLHPCFLPNLTAPHTPSLCAACCLPLLPLQVTKSILFNCSPKHGCPAALRQLQQAGQAAAAAAAALMSAHWLMQAHRQWPNR